MEHVRNPVHRLAHHIAVGNASLYDFQARMRLQKPVVAKNADVHVVVVVGSKTSIEEMAPHFARSARDQDAARDIRA